MKGLKLKGSLNERNEIKRIINTACITHTKSHETAIYYIKRIGKVNFRKMLVVFFQQQKKSHWFRKFFKQKE